MSIRIETLTSKTASDYKYSKNQTISTTTAGIDLGADMPEGGGSKPISITKVTSTPTLISAVNTTVTVEKEEG